MIFQEITKVTICNDCRGQGFNMIHVVLTVWSGTVVSFDMVCDFPDFISSIDSQNSLRCPVSCDSGI